MRNNVKGSFLKLKEKIGGVLRQKKAFGMEVLKRKFSSKETLCYAESLVQFSTVSEKKFLENVTALSNKLNNDSMEEWTIITDSEMDKFIKSKIFEDCPAADTEKVKVLQELIFQKFHELNKDMKSVYWGVLNIYGYEDLGTGLRFFKIPMIKIITSDYSSSYFILLNGLTFDNLNNVFNVIEGMPYCTMCVPSSYSCYINITLITENDMSLFKSMNNIHSDLFNECSIEIDFRMLLGNLSCNDLPEKMEVEIYPTKEQRKSLNENSFLMVEKLVKTIETNSSETNLDIEDHLRIEAFVHTSILSGVVKKLNYKWDRFIHIWMNSGDDKVTQAKDEVGNELYEKIDKGFIYEIFKQYWLSKRKLLFVNGSEEEKIYSFMSCDVNEGKFEPFIKEIKNDCDYQIVDFVSRNKKYKIVKFKDGKSFNIIFNEVIAGQILAFIVVRNLTDFFNEEEQLSPLSMVFDKEMTDLTLQKKPVIYNEEMFLNLPEEDMYLLKFYYLAREEQEFIARSQGYFNPRILLKPNEETLKSFVKLAMFGLDGSANPEAIKMKNPDKIVTSIAKKIIKMNKNFGKGRNELEKNAIYYDAIYIFGFKSSKKEKGKFYKVPVFKIYRTKDDLDPAFLDVDLHDYKNWKDFLDNNVLEKDYICVPKNGRYFNELTNELELEFLKNNPIYWTPGRAAAVGVNAAFFVAGTALAFYAGPIGWGLKAVEIANDVRLGVSGTAMVLSATGLGVSLSAKGFSHVNSKLETYGPNILLTIDVITQVLTIFGETSVFAGIAAGALTGGSIVLGGYLFCKILMGVYYKYQETGEFDPWDLAKIAGSALVFTNSVIRIKDIKPLLMSCGRKMPMLQGVSSSDMKITTEISKPNQWGRLIMEKAGSAETINAVRNLIGGAMDYFNKQKTMQDFLVDVQYFVKQLVTEVVDLIEPFLIDFLKKRMDIDVRKMTGNNKPISDLCRRYIDDFFAFIINGIKYCKQVMKRLFSSDDLTSRMLEPDAKLENVTDTLTRRLAIEGPVNPDSKETVEKMFMAEDFVESAIFEREIGKLKSCFAEDNEQGVNLELIKNETAEEILKSSDLCEFKKQFEKHCSGYEKLILLQEDERSKIYVFKYETEDDLKVIFREEDESIFNELKRKGENIYEYKGKDRNYFVCLQNDNPENRLGFLLIFYN